MRDFVIAQDGVRVRLESPCIQGWVTPKNLEELQTYAHKALDKDRYPGPKWIGAKLPADLMKKVLGTLHEFPHTETAYTLYYNATENKWDIKCPEQSGQGASVSFEDDGTGMQPGYTLMGSIHTHPEMGAFWSGTDLNDQKFKAGLHMVFGLRNGLVSQHKCTIFMPNAQEDQDIWDVIEQVDFNQVYEPVPEWVETIKKQSYQRAVTVKYFGGSRATGKSLPAGHYGGYNYNYNGKGKGYAGYDYNYGGQNSFDWNAYYGSCCGSNWGGWGDYYDDDIEDRSYTPSKTPAATYYGNIRYSIERCLDTNQGVLELADALLDQKIRGPIEQLAGIAIIDGCDKNDIMTGMESLMTGDTPLTDMDDEEARQIFEGLVDLKPDIKLVDPNNALGNDVNVGALCDILEGIVNSYSESECISADVLQDLLQTLKNCYEGLLAAQTDHDNPPQEVE